MLREYLVKSCELGLSLSCYHCRKGLAALEPFPLVGGIWAASFGAGEGDEEGE